MTYSKPMMDEVGKVGRAIVWGAIEKSGQIEK